jgi:hypothetical protein
MEFLNFIGCTKKGFELWYAPNIEEVPYEVREVTLMDERKVASFSIYDDALDFIEVNIKGMNYER